MVPTIAGPAVGIGPGVGIGVGAALWTGGSDAGTEGGGDPTANRAQPVTAAATKMTPASLAAVRRLEAFIRVLRETGAKC